MNKGTGIGFDALFGNVSMGIVVADQKGTIIMANPFLLQQFGYTKNELIDENIEKLIRSGFHFNHIHHIKTGSELPESGSDSEKTDVYAVRKNGTEFPVEVSLGSYETERGKFAIRFVSDVSKAKEAEDALWELNENLELKINERTQTLTSTVNELAQLITDTEAKDVELHRINSFLNSIWDHAEAIIYVTDKNGIIKMFNATAERQLGYSAAEIINLKDPLIFHDEPEIQAHSVLVAKQMKIKAPEGFSIFTSRTELGLPNEIEVTYIGKSGRRFPVLLTISAMRDTAGNLEGYLGIGMDISERRDAEADLRLALEKEKELSELKSRFVSMASHEFRTPLSTVLSSAYLISKYSEKEEHPKRERHVQRILSSVNMLTDILNDFLSVGKIEEGKIPVRYTTFDLKQNIQHIIYELNVLCKTGQTITYTHKGDSMVTLDTGLLKHIVMNLLSNAIKFSAERAGIKIETSLKEGVLTLDIHDNGLGISKEDQEHLFERFFRGENATNIQGTGLGLHIVSKYTELMNGTIRCASILGSGTNFTLTFLN